MHPTAIGQIPPDWNSLILSFFMQNSWSFMHTEVKNPGRAKNVLLFNFILLCESCDLLC